MSERSKDSLPKVPILGKARNLLARLFGKRVDDAREGVRGEVGQTLTQPDPLEREAWLQVQARGIQNEEVLAQTGDENGLWELAFQFLLQGKLDKAEALLKRHFGETISLTTFGDIGDYLLSHGKFEEAILAYRKAQSQEKLAGIYTHLFQYYTRPSERGKKDYNLYYFQRVFQMIHGRLPSGDEYMALGDSILTGGGNEKLAFDAFREALKSEKSPDKRATLHRRLGDIQIEWHLRSFPHEQGYLTHVADHYRQANYLPGLLRVAELSLQARRVYDLENIFGLLKLCKVADPKAWIKEKVRGMPRADRLRLLDLADITDGLIELGQECLAELKGGKDDESALIAAYSCFVRIEDKAGLKEVGDLYRTRGNIDLALNCYTTAGYKPDDPDYYQALGEYFCTRHAPAEAQKAFLKALQLRKGGGDGGGGDGGGGDGGGGDGGGGDGGGGDGGHSEQQEVTSSEQPSPVAQSEEPSAGREKKEKAAA